MDKMIKMWGRAGLAAAIIAFLLFSGALAYSIQDSLVYPDSGYKVDFLGVELVDPVNHQHTWTYAITAPDPIGMGQGLSHWTLEVNACYQIVAPENNAPYTTLTDIDLCTDGTYSCAASTYTAIQGQDPTTGVNGLKFEDPTPDIGPGETHVFQLTTQTIRNEISGATGKAAIKYGDGIELGNLTTPACDTNAIDLISLEASPSPGMPYNYILLAGALISLAGVFILRRRLQG
jgi:hypothetical protein